MWSRANTQQQTHRPLPHSSPSQPSILLHCCGGRGFLRHIFQVLQKNCISDPKKGGIEIEHLFSSLGKEVKHLVAKAVSLGVVQ